MQRLIILGAILALAVARPEMYKEKEDFQYSRSSSDDGTKSGYYGAQRGNMGGNYEKAHNMDNLAQNQMSGLVKQVEGELGDGAKMRTGSVYTAANSRGSYGSGHYDLSNLGGRNFQEGTYYDNSQARSSQSSSAYNSAGYTSGRTQSAIHSGYQTAGQSGLSQQSGDLPSADNLQGSNLYDYGRHSSHSAGYQSQSGFREHNEYDLSNTNLHSGGYGSNTQTRLISGTPVRIVVRPGTRVAIPVAAQTYDATYGSSLVDHNSLNTDAETLRSNSQHSVYRPSTAKHYESSYNYRKEWEKHDTIPSTVPLPTPTHNSFPANSELNEDSQFHMSGGQYDASRIDSQRAHSSNIYSGYNANVKSSSSQSRSNYDSQHQGGTSGSSLNAYTSAGRNTGSNYQVAADSGANGYSHNSGSRYYGTTADASSLTQAAYNAAGHNTNLNSQVEDISGKPKSYHSSYSYHKSWERQGDPYVIKPVSSGYYDTQTSQRLTSSTKNAGYAMSGSHYQHQGGVDCDENGHIRVARSYNTDDYQQQSQNIEDLGQQVEDLGQQTQSNWDQQETQQSQNSWDKLEDLSQQSQGNWDQQETQQSQNSWDKLEDLTQQSQSHLGQQSQNSWDKLKDLSQQSQTNLGQQETQQSQKSWDKLEDLSQQSQTNLGQQETQQSQNSWDKLEDLSQQSQTNLGQQETQQSQNSWDKLDDLTQQSQSNWGQQETQKSQNSWDKLEDLNQQPQSLDQQNKNDYGQHTQDTGAGLENKHMNVNHETHNQWNINEYNQHNKHEESTFYQRENSQYSHTQDDKVAHQPSVWNKFDNVNQNIQQNSSDWNSNIDQYNKHLVSQFENMDQQFHNAWDHSDATSQSESSYVNTQSNSGYFNSHSYGNTDQFTHFQEQEKGNDNSSQANTFDRVAPNMAPLSNLWNKLNQQSIMFTDTGIDNTYKENNFTEINTSSHHLYESSGHKQTNHSDSAVQQHYSSQINPHIEPQINKVSPSVNSEEKERPEDIGRGDIGPEKLAHAVPDTAVKEDANKQLSVLSLDQQTSKNKTDQKIYNGNILTNAANHSQTASYLQSVNEKPNQKVDIQQSLQGFEDHQNTEQQNMEDFGQQSLQNFGQNENVEQGSVQGFGQHNFEEQNLQDFGQQNVQDFGQQNLQDFRQQNMQEFNQHDNQAHQDLQDFGEQNLHDFRQHGNLEQQNLQDFSHAGNLEQQNLQNYGQQNLRNLEQQHLTDFSQQERLQQQNLNQELNISENLQQQNQQNIGQQAREKLLDFRQNYYQEQQNLLSQNPEHNLNRTSYTSNTNLQPQDNLAQPKEVEQSIQKQKNSDILESNPKTELVTPIEPTTEKPGFWSSVGNKFSSAKSKIASWFKS